MAKSASRYGARSRRDVVLLLLGICALALVARLVYLQVVERKFLVKQGNARAVRVQTENALRGMILDREGEPLAISTPVSSVVANPKVLLATLEGDFGREREACLNDASYSNYCSWINDKDIDTSITLMRYQQSRLRPLAKLLNVPVDKLFSDIEKRGKRGFYYLKRNIPPNQMDAILDLDVKGITRQDSFQRFYPASEYAGQVLGFTNVDGKGQAGIEKQFDTWLSGEPGQRLVLASRTGTPLQVVGEKFPPAPGQSLQLSIDKRIQFVMQNVLQQTKNEFQAKSVSAVMEDVRTGEILGMVSLPDGNPNNPVERIPQLMKNRVVTDVFEPGSTIKPIAMAAALQYNAVKLSDKFSTHGYFMIGGHRVRDDGNYGVLDPAGIIRKSSNIGMSMISQRLPRADYYEFLRNLSFGKRTGIEFPGEAIGILQNENKLGDFSYATTLFGYGIAVNALQLVHAYATIANDGKSVPLTLIKRQTPAPFKQVIKPQVANEVLTMLKGVTGQGGTGTRANTTSYTVAGKTGTAHTLVNGVYAKNQYRGLFAGIAPASNPRIALVVVVENPQKSAYFGGLVAAPAFSKITEWSLNILGVLPDKISKTDNVKLKIDPDVFKGPLPAGDAHDNAQ